MGKIEIRAAVRISPEEELPKDVIAPALILGAGAGKIFQSAMEAERHIGGIDAGIPPAAQLQAQGRIHTGMQEAFIKTAGVPENRGLYCHAG